MAQYQSGLVNVTKNSTAVTGVGAAWLTEVASGHLFSIKNENVWYEIDAVSADGALTLKSAYVGDSKTGANYAIQRDFTTSQSFALPSYGDTNISALMRATLLKLDAYLATFSPVASLLNGSMTVSGDLEVNIAGGLLWTNASAIGYAAGAGGAVTQTTSRTTAVTLNKPAGAITLAAGAPTVGAWVSFTVNNSLVAAADTVVVSMRGATNSYVAHVSDVAAGTFRISLQSIAGAVSDAPIVNFAILKGATA